MGANNSVVTDDTRDGFTRKSMNATPVPYTAVVVGAGIVGVSIAHELARRGYMVTVMDRHPEPGMGSTYLCPAYVPERYHATSWRDQYNLLREFPLKRLTEFHFWKWFALYFAVPRSAQEQAGTDLLRVSRSVRSEYSLTHPTRVEGVLDVNNGALEHVGYTEDPRRVTLDLVEACKQKGVRFMQGTAERLAISPTYVQEYCKHVCYTDENGQPQQIAADRVVICAGDAATSLLSPRYIFPLMSVAGYSMEFTPTSKAKSFVPDTAHNIKFGKGFLLRTQKEGSWRISGFASLDTDWKESYNIAYVKGLFSSVLKSNFGQDIDDFMDPNGDITVNRFVRPWTPDGVPIVGRVGHNMNLYAAIGHGYDGYAWAAGSARIIAEIMESQDHLIDTMPMSSQRFLPERALVSRVTHNASEGYLTQFENWLGACGRRVGIY
eukprot:PhM_4_TR7289/c0_g1_i1/m.50207/K00285/dadA; D-amino-acid dehydrogenase